MRLPLNSVAGGWYYEWKLGGSSPCIHFPTLDRRTRRIELLRVSWGNPGNGCETGSNHHPSCDEHICFQHHTVHAPIHLRQYSRGPTFNSFQVPLVDHHPCFLIAVRHALQVPSCTSSDHKWFSNQLRTANIEDLASCVGSTLSKYHETIPILFAATTYGLSGTQPSLLSTGIQGTSSTSQDLSTCH